MDLTVLIWGLVQPALAHILREVMRNRESIKMLLQKEDTMESVIRGLNEMLDQLERRVSSPGMGDSTETELFNNLARSVRKLHGNMQEIREAYRDKRTGWRFSVQSMKDYRRNRVYRKLRDQFKDVVRDIYYMETCQRFIIRQAGGGGGSSSSGIHVDTPMIVDTNSTTADTPTVRGHGRQLRSLSSSQINRQGGGHRSSRAYEAQKSRVITPVPSWRGLSQTRRDMNKAIFRRQKQGKCRNCGWYGHREYKCFNRCGKCNRTGHKISECPGDVVCYSCGEVGHMQGDCD
ncbi:hypothetical protein BO83DRAFT_415241 [Aspergillus eucalypticola CBS 122712]|uniref:CCHC-type domain-containing protein n=1 Tax=Aspergillus eucalypticola (strain CBS 122712 / IBT 29274) TaxID=1448314 RepID=A0A317W0J5_ASPEC|nr:uncharacterized protein BO83DRAFT_415241 [Aspergillus eucalypticola CBS 122712]PWY78752.1 hypothetical protein BO83DRAFT_415241 [Aspergillus eucalypticola CBS 122712]